MAALNISLDLFTPRYNRRAKANDDAKAAASKSEERLGDKLKRQPVGPREGHFVSTKNAPPEDVAPIAFDFLI